MQAHTHMHTHTLRVIGRLMTDSRCCSSHWARSTRKDMGSRPLGDGSNSFSGSMSCLCRSAYMDDGHVFSVKRDRKVKGVRVNGGKRKDRKVRW